MFDSRNVVYKNPFGAVRVNQPVDFLFPLKYDGAVYGISLIVKKYTGEVVNIPMLPKEYTNGFGGYSTQLILSEEGIYFYCFEVYTTDGNFSVGRGKGGEAVAGSGKDWQLTVYDGYPNAAHPLHGGVIYHIFADRFRKGETDRKPDKKYRMKDWNELPEVEDPDGVFRADDFFGGNAEGIIEKLDYIKSLGVNAIYLSPIFESSSNHRYDTGDYFKIDGLFADEDTFKKLIEESKKRGIIIIIDGVFNHTGADSKYFNKNGRYPSLGAYQSRDSEYYDWFNFKKFPDKYDCWWGIEVVPTLNKSNPKVSQFIRD
ncbi:MAG: glycoside hydrolase family 13 protein, partial [Clostridiales bacterium]|nr:glycoside hydrolase family 13 protein [Clostridiales bacterium]